jgi:hypothetical protein
MIELTEQQRRELTGAEPIRVRNPDTDETYVLVKTEIYERMKALLSEDWAEGAYLSAMDVFREGWDDPRMDVYDELDPRRQ